MVPAYINVRHAGADELVDAGEKRKRKLQYLQQLLHDHDSGEEQQASRGIMDSVEDGRERSMSAEYSVQSDPINSMGFSPDMGYATMSSASGNIIDPAHATTATYSNQLLATNRAFPDVQASWSASMYQPPPPMNMPTWDTSQWMPPVDFSQHLLSSRPSSFNFHQAAPQQMYSQVSSPLPQPQETVPSNDYFFPDQYHPSRRAATHSPGVPNVSQLSFSHITQEQYSMKYLETCDLLS
jgi:hypothetical protein